MLENLKKIFQSLKKTKNFNKSLEKYSQETVKNFYDDAKKSGYSL